MLFNTIESKQSTDYSDYSTNTVSVTISAVATNSSNGLIHITADICFVCITVTASVTYITTNNSDTGSTNTAYIRSSGPD